jgi:hypothetical protein
MRRAEEWGRIVEHLPLDRVFQIDYRLLSDRLAEIPDDANEILRLFDGRRTLAQVIEEAGHEDLAGARILSRLFVEKIIQPVERETRVETHDEARAQDDVAREEDVAREKKDDVQGSGVGGTEDWFAGPVGAESAPAPTPAQAGVADGHLGAETRGDQPPRIVRFPARRRAERGAQPDALPGVRHGPAPETRPEVAHDRAPRVNAEPAPAPEIVRAGAPHPAQEMGRGSARTTRKRALVVALLVASALAATGIGVWKMLASRPAASVESATPTATSISAPIGPDSSK